MRANPAHLVGHAVRPLSKVRILEVVAVEVEFSSQSQAGLAIRVDAERPSGVCRNVNRRERQGSVLGGNFANFHAGKLEIICLEQGRSDATPPLKVSTIFQYLADRSPSLFVQFLSHSRSLRAQDTDFQSGIIIVRSK